MVNLEKKSQDLVHFRDDLNLALDRVVLGSSEDSDGSRSLLAALLRLELFRRPLWSVDAASSLPFRPLVLSPLL